MSLPEPRPRFPMCDLCGERDADVVETMSPPYPDDRRRERARNHHRACVKKRRKADFVEARMELERRKAERERRRAEKEANDG